MRLDFCAWKGVIAPLACLFQEVAVLEEGGGVLTVRPRKSLFFGGACRLGEPVDFERECMCVL